MGFCSLRSKRGGFALVFVLWGVAIASLIAAIVLPSSRMASLVGRQAVLSAQQEAWAEAVTNRAVLGLLDSRKDHRWRVDAVPNRFDFGGRSFMVTIQDQYGLIDLNAASRETLVSLLSSNGLSSAEADSQTDHILDWRDRSYAKRLNGAKDADYKAAGLTYGPRQGEFASLDELRLVLGMTGQLYQKLRPAMTVYSGSPSINPATAPFEVLRGLQGYDEARAHHEVAQRGIPEETQGSTGPVSRGLIDPQISIAGWSFRIDVCQVEQASTKPITSSVIRLSGRPEAPYWTLSRY